MTQQPKTYLFWFPLIGIKLDESAGPIDTKMFGDVTLCPDTSLDKWQYDEIHEWLAERIKQYGPIHSFLTVRRAVRGPTPDVDAPGHHEAILPVFTQATSRVGEIAAALAIAFRVTEGKACALAGQVFTVSSPHPYQQVGSPTPTIVYVTSAIPMTAAGDGVQPLIVTAEKLRKLRKHAFLAPLMDILVKCPGRRPFERAVAQSAVLAADAMHMGVGSLQLITAVTAIDSLFSGSPNDRWDTRKERVRAILGPASAEECRSDDILDARCRWVHEATDEQPLLETAHGAVDLAVRCLIRAAQLTQELKSKEQFLRYLDLLYRADESRSEWGEPHECLIKRLLKHSREHIDLPMINV